MHNAVDLSDLSDIQSRGAEMHDFVRPEVRSQKDAEDMPRFRFGQ